MPRDLDEDADLTQDDSEGYLDGEESDHAPKRDLNIVSNRTGRGTVVCYSISIFEYLFLTIYNLNIFHVSQPPCHWPETNGPTP